MASKKRGGKKLMHLHHWPFQWTRWCAGALQIASPDAAVPGLPRKPLDTAIGQLLAPYCPSGHQGNSKWHDDKKMDQLCWPFWWLRSCAGTIPRALPDGGGPGLWQKPLDAAIGWVLRPIDAIGHACASLFEFLIITHKRRSRVDAEAPVFNRGMTYQTKKKGLTKVST